MSEESEKKGWLARLRAGLSRSSSRLSDGIGGIFSGRKLDDAALEELEDLLITSDLGVETAAKLSASLAGTRFDKEVSADEIRTALADEMSAIMEPVARPLAANAGHRPHVILVTGVNGSGKTTTIGKLAKRLREDGKSVMLAAGDTCRAAAIEQLKIWGERTGCTVVASEQGDGELLQGLPATVVLAEHDPSLDGFRQQQRVFFASRQSMSGVLEGIQHYRFQTRR